MSPCLLLRSLRSEVDVWAPIYLHVFCAVQSMFPKASPIEGTECIICQTNEECAQNAMCCPGSCGRTRKTPVNSKSPPNPGGGEEPAGSRVCLERTHSPLPTHQLCEPHLPVRPSLQPAVHPSPWGLELPRALPDHKTDFNKCPIHEIGLFSHGVSKVHSANMGHERALGGKSDHLSPVGVPKAGFCPWNLLQMISSTGPCPMKIECSSDRECSGNMKCCNVDCVMTCTPPVPGMQSQNPGPPLLPRSPLAPTLPCIRSKCRYNVRPAQD
jgi:hypothetical protein